ncbi:hypothetical protein DES53_105193 [Roseimicrobium gellanilyticum]|uniref:Uncharacterized protein n=1 Tax=Roseimicrobium gellanilyticum TaxID=748857 RepID=A0A366HLP6_9BACT|nr:hypothetical protein [Roseimicrobium gellanilyticum]RBP43794.1 hypothetical protein DES53_105193 [Roseimicrobium gellanilyticum]
MRFPPLQPSLYRALQALLCLSVPALGQVANPPSLEATLDVGEQFRNGVSLIWSPVGNATWSDLLDFHQVDKIHMDPRSPTAEVLNAFQMDKSKVLPPGTFTFAGEDSPESRDKVREALKKQVGASAASMIGPYVPPDISASNPARPVLMVCSIARQPFFPSHFAPDPNPRLFTDRLGVHHRTLGFGTAGKFASQYTNVEVLADDLAGHQVLRLDFASTGLESQEFVVLSTPGQHRSMEEAVKEIHGLLGKVGEVSRVVEVGGVKYQYTSTLEAGDELWIPYLQARVLGEYPDLVGKSYLKSPDGRRWWELRQVSQFLNWKLDHTGAVVEATAAAAAAPQEPFGDPPASQQAQAQPKKLPLYRKQFIFNKPFIASLWRKGSDWPYLACWMDGPEMLMEKK